MWFNKLFFVLGFLHTVYSQWTCVEDSQCADLPGGVCNNGRCGCATGQQIVLSGTACVDLAPYHMSVCVEDHQCSRLFTSFHCRYDYDTQVSQCACQPGHHYFLGRCWPAVDFGGACSWDEQCIGTPRNPYNMQCSSGVCVCAQGYYERQRGECRKIAYAVGDGCVIDEDCQFPNGVCEINSRQCVSNATLANSNQPSAQAVTVNSPSSANLTSVSLTAVTGRTHGVACNVQAPCDEPFVCSAFGACLCPIGYYASEDRLQCYAELGSLSTPEQCVGLLAEVIGGVCSCPPNFFFEENMRDCVKVTRRITDSCVTDENCHTFGAAAVCGPPAEPWALRSCECDTERAVWDASRQMCRLFAGIGEQCSADDDCLAGELQIQCVLGACACPEGLVAAAGLCLTTGLGVGEACQASVECSATQHTECAGGLCSCADGYQQIDDFCAPVIGGSCARDDDCVIENTECVDGTHTCRCRAGYVASDDVCWPVASGYEAPCNVTLQCAAPLGESSTCDNGTCRCDVSHHHRDGSCWPVTGIFEPCRTTSQCYLQDRSEWVVCRNSVCQCDFDYPYSERERTCVPISSASSVMGSVAVVTLALVYLVLS